MKLVTYLRDGSETLGTPYDGMVLALAAAQNFGGMGVMRELPLQKYVRDALIFLHSENTNDVARLRIAEDLAGYRRPGLMGSGG